MILLATVKVTTIDDWSVLHLSAENVHCGTNVLRSYGNRWWPARTA